MRRPSSGFTLVEVLIAATILFAVLAVAAESYRSALLASRRAEGVVAMLTPLPLITASIRNALRESPAERARGEAELLGVRYRWEAETVRHGAPPPRFDPDAADFVEYPPRFRLYDVRLRLERGTQRREYLYRELAWEPLQR